MAYTKSNEIKTRISLKYDTLANWQTNNPALLAGEVAFVQIGEVTVDNKGNRVIPPVMFKVGPGNFNDLGWGAATAADVYSWAKAEHLALTVTEADAANDGEYVNGLAWDSATHTLKPQMVSFDSVIDDTTKESTNAPQTKAVKAYVDAKVQEAVTGGTAGLATETYVNTQITNNAVNTVVEGSTNGTIAVDGTDVAVHGLGSAAFTESTAYDASGAAAAVLGTAGDAVGAFTVHGAMKQATASASAAEKNAKDYADSLAGNYDASGAASTVKSELIGAVGDATTASTIYGAKAYADLKIGEAVKPLATTESVNNAINGLKTTEIKAAADAAAAAQKDATQALTDAAAAQKTADDVTARVEAFLDGEEIAGTVDTLKEIQEELKSLGEAVELETQFAAKADKTTTITGTGSLTGGGDLSANRTLDLTDAAKNDIAAGKAASQTIAGYGNIVTHDVSEFATSAQGGKADTAVQKIKIGTSGEIAAVNGVVDLGDKLDVHEYLGLGSAALRNDTDFASIAQGMKADSAVQSVTTGQTAGTINVDGTDVAVNGLKSAAFAETTAFDAAGAAAGVKTELIGGTNDVSTSSTIYGAKKYADLKVENAVQALDSSVAATAESNNQVSVLTGVTQTDGKLTAKTEVKLAAVAKTGNVADLSQTANTYVLFNCGSSSDVI